MIKSQIDSQRFHIASFPYSSEFVQKIKAINCKKWHIKNFWQYKISKTTEIYAHIITKDIGKINDSFGFLKLIKRDDK